MKFVISDVIYIALLRSTGICSTRTLKIPKCLFSTTCI